MMLMLAAAIGMSLVGVGAGLIGFAINLSRGALVESRGWAFLSLASGAMSGGVAYYMWWALTP